MRNLLLIVFFSLAAALFAQSPADADAKFKALSDKNSEFHRKTDGEYDGYRIKIHFGSDRSAASEVKQKFTAKYSNIPAYEDYRKMPNFVITVGDYKTRVDAFEAWKKIQVDFPNAFIIKSKIKPNK
jgi:hypothetical protein